MLVLLYKLHFKRAQTLIKSLGLKSELFWFWRSPNALLLLFFLSFLADLRMWTHVKWREIARFCKSREVLPRSQERPR